MVPVKLKRCNKCDKDYVISDDRDSKLIECSCGGTVEAIQRQGWLYEWLFRKSLQDMW